MLCPNCSEQLDIIEVSNQKVLHCKNCGGNFFEENSINRISARDAETLTKDAQENIITGNPKICPKDSIFLHLIDSDEAVPHNISLFRCPKCRGIFAYPDDLLKFKKAQNIKIEFFKIWQNPLPALKTVLVLSFIAVLSVTVYSNLTNRSIQSTQAESIVGTVTFTNEGRYLFVNFHTQIPYLSSILIHDKTTNRTVIDPINKEPASLHYVAITNVDLHHDLYYQIILSDGKGLETKTEEKKLIFQN